MSRGGDGISLAQVGMGRAETPSPCGGEIVTDRTEFDARAWNTGKIAGTPGLLPPCKLSAPATSF